MNKLLQHVELSIARRQLLRNGQRLLLAVSGGLDSMVLLETMRQLAVRHQWRMGVAHFNHQLRGAASDADERLVAREAKQHGLRFFHGAWPKSAQHAAKEFGLEMAARLARHRFLAKAARQFGTRTIALAHHADDQVELFFLRLLRGAGGGGLAGMKWSGPSPARAGLTLVRPLLDLPKSALMAFARESSVRFREDATNRCLDHDRNWLRRELLPRLVHRFGAPSVAGLLRSMEVVGTDADFARQEAARFLVKTRGGSFQRLHPAVQRQVLRLELQRLGFAAEFHLVEHLRSKPMVPITAAGGGELISDARGRVRQRQHQATDFNEDEIELCLSEPGGEHRFDGVTVRWRFTVPSVKAGLPQPQAGRESFNAAQVGAAIRLRHWRTGDRFQPIGMSRAVKLQNLFTNLKIPGRRRRELLVAEAANGEIFWVEGVRIGENFKLAPRTRRRLDWSWLREASSASSAAR